MAINTNAPFGFAVSSRQGAAVNYQVTRRWISPSNSTPIYTGDPVVQLSTGYVALPSAVNTQVSGIFLGCEYMSISQKKWVASSYWPGSDANTSLGVAAKVIDDPLMLFRVQSYGTGPMTFASIGLNAAWVQPSGLSPDPHTFGRSSAAIDVTTNAPATTSTFPFRIIDLITDPPGAPGTDIANPYNWVLVAFNNQDFKTLTGI
jgi:hypothetical protein